MRTDCRKVLRLDGDFDGVVSCVLPGRFHRHHEGLMSLVRDGKELSAEMRWSGRPVVEINWHDLVVFLSSGGTIDGEIPRG